MSCINKQKSKAMVIGIFLGAGIAFTSTGIANENAPYAIFGSAFLLLATVSALCFRRPAPRTALVVASDVHTIEFTTPLLDK